MSQSEITARVSVWHPQAPEIRVRPFRPDPEVTPGRREYWYLELAPRIDICVGNRPDLLVGDLAAMRALAAAAIEAENLLMTAIEEAEAAGALPLPGMMP
jgi:hypothetical protein